MVITNRIFAFVILFCLSVISGHSQDVCVLQLELDSLIESKSSNSIEIIEKARIQKQKIDLQTFEIYYRNYRIFEDVLKRQRILKSISSIQFYLYSYSKEDKVRASKLYHNSTRDLIFECRGDLDKLKNIEVHYSFRSSLYPFLKIEIEQAGGKWDKGEIPKANYRIEQKAQTEIDKIFKKN